MRILFSISSLKGGGMERVMSVVSSELVARGHDVCIAMNRNEVGYEIDSRVRLLPSPNPLPHLPGEGRLHRLYVHVHNKLHYDRHIATAIKKEHPDAVVSFMNCYLALVVGHGRVPVVMSERNCLHRKNNLLEKFNRFFLNRFFDRIVVLSRHDQTYASRWLKNTVVIPNALTYQPLSPEEYESEFGHRRNLLACGRLDEPVKGFDRLIAAWSQVAGRHPQWKLEIAGGGKEASLQKYKSLAKEAGVEDSVVFLGHCKNMQQLMRQHSIFVLSSRREGFPNVLSEAMSQGCACAAFDCITGPSEIIIDTIDGLLVDNQNTDALAAALDQLMEDSQLRHDLGRRAIEDVKRFSRQRVIDQWEGLLRQLAAATHS